MEVSTSWGEYEVKERIGGRKTSVVWRAVHGPSGREVALKQVRLAELTAGMRASLDCEVSFLRAVRHPNIVRLLDVLRVCFPFPPPSSFTLI